MDARIVTDGVMPPERVVIPRRSALAWRLAPLADDRRVDLVLRLFGAAALPIGATRGRLAAMGLPPDVTERALRRIRHVHDWDVAWTWAAQLFLAEARVLARTGQEETAALHQRHAALAYHLAAMLVFDDVRELRTLRASASTLFARAVKELHPTVHRVECSWRAARLPGYLVQPSSSERFGPLVVLLNGTSTSKEETILWSDAFLAHGLAVLALDWPGSGESALTLAATADCDDLLDGIVRLAEEHPGIDGNRIGLIGFSLGGTVAAHVAANDRRVAAVIAVTPPYDARPWLHRAQPLLLRHLDALAGGPDRARHLASDFAVRGIVSRARCPILVIGAGRDLIVPPEEAIRYCAEAGSRGTLLWYPDGSHGLYERLPEWTTEAARWFLAVTEGTSLSTWVDPTPAAAAIHAS
jgi:alpha-beta hydrolase superfamily lysophospholipase